MQLTCEHKQTRGQSSAKSHMHTVEFTSGLQTRLSWPKNIGAKVKGYN